MTATAEKQTELQEKAKALREEIRRWTELANQVEEQAGKTNDSTGLGIMQLFLKSGRDSLKDLVKPDPMRNYHIDPIVPSPEITLPSFPMPGEGETVEFVEGYDRLPDPTHIPDE